MSLEQVFDFLSFWINKKTGAWYTISELTEVVDRGQMALYSDLKPRYGTDILVQEKLSPFVDFHDFDITVSGLIAVPTSKNYLDLLDLEIQYGLSARTMYYSVPFPSRSEFSARKNDQIDPVTVTSPIGEIVSPGNFRLTPTSNYLGRVTFLRRPVKPVFGYSVISGRVIVYNANTSTQLEWRETEITPVLLKALQSIGINLSDTEVQNFAQIKTQENWQGGNRL